MREVVCAVGERLSRQDSGRQGDEGSTAQVGEHQDPWGFMLRPLEPPPLNCRWRGRGIPLLKERPECPIQRPRSGLQQQVCAALGPLHLLAFGEALADDGIHR
jgi:hypothetical protein